MLKQRLHFFYPRSPFDARIEYVLDFLSNHPLCPEGLIFCKNENLEERDIAIYYGQAQAGKGFFIPASAIVFTTPMPSFPDLKPHGFHYEAFTLYGLRTVALEEEVPFFTDRRFGFDLLETIFFHISRIEEHHCTPDQLDTWDMMKSSEQFLSKHGLEEEPVVDHLVYCFFAALGLAVEKPKTVYRMSHDIDVLEKFPNALAYLKAAAKLVLGGKGWKLQKDLFLAYWKRQLGEKEDPFDTFDWLLKKGTWSGKTIYFMAGGITKFDNHYEIEDRRIKGILALAKANGYSIGLHPSYAAWKKDDLFLAEKKRLEKVVGEEVVDSRQHFLHFSFEHTPKLLEANGIKRDSSLGYQDRIGFRCGTGFPYRLYNFQEERAFSFWEIPMVFMDCALLGEENDVAKFGLHLEKFLAKNKNLTAITFNFHNSTFDPGRLDQEALIRIYKSLEEIEAFL